MPLIGPMIATDHPTVFHPFLDCRWLTMGLDQALDRLDSMQQLMADSNFIEMHSLSAGSIHAILNSSLPQPGPFYLQLLRESL